VRDQEHKVAAIINAHRYSGRHCKTRALNNLSFLAWLRHQALRDGA